MEGPGIAPPASVPAGLEGFHAAWFGQSGYRSLCPGQTATAVVAYYNSGSFGWVQGRMGEMAYLGTWGPEPGQDQASPLGGDGQLGSPNTGWPRYNRVAAQPAAYVGPGQVAWFTFSYRAPDVPGSYRLAVRPVIEGATWMEDYGVFWAFTVLRPDGSGPSPTIAPTGSPSVTPTPSGTPTATASATSTATVSPTATPTLTPTATPTPTPTPTSTAPAGSRVCMEIIGFSQTRQWYFGGPPGFDQFLSQMPPRGTQLRWEGGAAIDSWADPSFSGWSTGLVNSCATGSSSPDRIVMNISGGFNSDVNWWHDQTAQAVANARRIYPGVRTVYLQPVVGGPGGGTCFIGGNQVRATYNEPYINAAIARLVSEGVGTQGANPHVGSCSEYDDDIGHLTSDVGASDIGTKVGAFYSTR